MNRNVCRGALLLLIAALASCRSTPPDRTSAADSAAGDAGRPPAIAPAQLGIGGDVPRPYTLTAADFDGLPTEIVTAADHGLDTAEYRGVPLASVLERAGVTFGDSIRGSRLATYVLVEAADGYRAVFSLPELDPRFGHGGVYLVDQADGAPLSSAEGPFRLVLPDEARHARWVRQVTGITIETAGVGNDE